MAIPTMNFYPFVANLTNGGQGKKSNDGAFDGLLASFATASTGDKSQSSAHAAANAKETVNALEQVLSALSGGKVNLKAPGLGLTAPQRDLLAGKLEKLAAEAQDGAQLLASLLAAAQAASVALKPADVVAITKLLGSGPDGAMSIGALKENLQLLAQASQLVAASDGSLTLVDALKALTGPSDAFVKHLADALAAPEIEDTGPPGTAGSGGPPPEATTASATAGSDGRELTAATTAASPADGAAEEAGQPDTAILAEVLEALVKAAPQPSVPSTPQTTGPAAPAAVAANATAQAQAAAAAALPSTTPSAPTSDHAPSAPASAPQLIAQNAPAQASVTAAAAGPETALQSAQLAAATVAPQVAGQPTAVKAAVVEPKPAPKVAAPAAPAPALAKAAEVADGDASQAVQAAATPLAPAAAQAPALGCAAPASADDQQPKAQAHDTSTAPLTPATAAAGLLAGSTQAVEPNRVAAELPVRAAVEQAIVDQVVQNATIALKNGQQEFRIQLKPDFLGALDVRVSIDAGAPVVRMAAQNAATRQLIETNLDQLRQAFGTSDIRVEHTPTFASSDAPWSFSQGGHQGYWQGQNPFDGSNRLPEAIAFKGDPSTMAQEEPRPDEVVAPVQPAPTGAIDIQA